MLLITLVLLTVVVSGYDIIKLSKMRFYNAKNDGYVIKQNHCSKVDYEFFERRMK